MSCVLLWVYLHSKFPVIKLLDQERCTSNFNRYCQIILKKADHWHFQKQVWEWQVAHLMDIDQFFIPTYLLTENWHLIYVSIIMSEVNHVIMFLSNFLCTHVYTLFFPWVLHLDLHESFFKVKKYDYIANIFPFIFFVIWLYYMNHVMLKILDFRFCVLLKNAFPAPKLSKFLSVSKS